MKTIYCLLPLLLMLYSCKPKVPVDPGDIPDETDITTPLPPGNAFFDQWIHQPLHPGNNKPVNFTINASDPQLITKVELALYEYELYKNNLGLPSKRKRGNGMWGVVDVFEPNVPVSEINHTFTFSDGFPAHSNVEYIFSVYSLSGEVSRQMALFDAGDSPWPQDKILLYATSREPLEKSINLCFFPDTDFNDNWSLFLSDTEDLIYKGYHSSNQIASNKEAWSFYYTQYKTDGLALSQDPFNPDRFPPFMKDSLILGIDAFGLLHREPYSDGAYLDNNIQFLAQNVFTSESYNWGTAIHETAHAVFHLSDEYNGCVCFASLQSSNIFRERFACETFNEELGHEAEECTEILGYDGQPWYLPEQPPLFATIEECREYNIQNGLPPDSCRLFQDFSGPPAFQAFNGVCIMQDDGDAKVPAFRHACSAVIDNYYSTLRPGDPEPVDLVLAESVDNFFGYEPVIVLSVDMGGGKSEITVKEVRYGVPTKTVIMGADLRISMPGVGKSPYQLNLDRPDCVHMHHGKGKADVKTAEQAVNCNIAIPMLEGLEEVICEDYRFGKSAETHSFNLRQELLEKIKDFKK